MKNKIKWTKTMDTGECRCYEPNVEGLGFIWWHSWEGYVIGNGKERKYFKTLKEAKEYVSSLVK